MKVNSMTKLIGLIGNPVKHSFSPIMHNYLFNKYNKNNIYTCFDVSVNNLNHAVDGIKSLGIEGLNVTIPHKVEIIKYLDYIDDKSKLIGAVNTIKNKGGILEGYNTDGVGFVKSIKDKNYNLENKNIMVLGAGGACRSICIELASNNIKSIEIRNRSIKNAAIIEKAIVENFDTNVKVSDVIVCEEDLKDIDVLINTTPIGMESNECPINENIKIKKDMLICDIVYKPHNTNFIQWAKNQGCQTVYGIDMLINQGLEAFYIWTGIMPTELDAKEIKALYEEYISK